MAPSCPGTANFLFIPGGTLANWLRNADLDNNEAWFEYLAKAYLYDEDLHCAVLERSALAWVWQ